jgi:hypothetical protein
MFTKMQDVYFREGHDGMKAWYESLSPEEQERLRMEIHLVAINFANAFEPIKQAIATAIPRIVEAMQPLINAYKEANPAEFERLVRKERSRRRYERMMKRTGRWN